MARHIPQSEIESTGFDSFLDIVANLVGILVILIMVLGVRAEEAWRSSAVASDAGTATSATDSPGIPFTALSEPAPDLIASEPPVADPIPELPDLETPKRKVEQLRLDAGKIDAEIRQIEKQATLQQAERDQLSATITLRGQDLTDQRAQLADIDHEQLELQRQLAESEQRLDQITQQRLALDGESSKPAVIEHHPTPLAKTVFGREEHFRLLRGRLTYVPLTQLTQQLQNEARNKVWKLKDARETTETIGPVDGFYLKYTIGRRERAVPTETGIARRQTVELVEFVLLPTSEELGVPLADALADGSPFSDRLSRLNPDEVTITVWTYPDSYPEFRRVKQFVWSRGFLAAARPMPNGLLISGSPHGSSSAAE